MKVSQMVAFVLVVLFIPTVLLGQEKMPESVKKAMAKLDVDKADPEANLTVGKYLLGAGKVADALECLAKGSDANLRALALKDHDAAEDLVGLGEAWVDAAKKNPTLRQPMVDRGMFWYAKAWDRTVDATEKNKLRAVFARIQAPPPGYNRPAKNGEVAAGWTVLDTIGSFVDPTFARSGSRSAKLLLPPVNGRKESYIETPQFPVVPGKKYMVTAWVFSDKTDTDGTFQFRAYARDNPNALVQKNFTIPMDSPFWQKVGGEIEVPEDTFRCLVFVDNKGKTGAMWVDDVSVTMGGKEFAKNGGFEERK